MATKPKTAEATEEGKFLKVLTRTNTDIKKDRAQTIADKTKLKFKRKIEDLELSIKEQERELEGMLDLSPSNIQSLVVANDFDADKFVSKYNSIGVSIRKDSIILSVMKAQYNELFSNGTPVSYTSLV